MGHTLRLKISSGAIALLTLFAISLAVTLFLVSDSGEEISGIVEYHHPIEAKIAALDVYTFELEILAREFAADVVGNEEQQKKFLARAAELTTLNQQLLEDSVQLAQAGSEDKRNDVDDRIVLGQLRGRLNSIRPELNGYLNLLNKIISLGQGRKAAEKKALLLELREHDSIDTLVSEARKLSSELISRSLKETDDNIFGIVWTNVGLFSLATLLGLAVFLLITGRVHRAIHRLIDAFARTASGKDLSPLPITSSDEIGALSGSFNQMIEQLKAKQKLQESFGQFIDPRILANLVDAKTGELRQTAERRKVTIFFCDVVKFSAIGEQLTADALVKLLNHYFTAATTAILENNGIVDKFIGDAVMAFWASPFSEGEFHARDACLACLEMVKEFDRIRSDISNITGLRRAAPDFQVRLALASGDTLIGTVGSTTKKSFTVMGDTVNIASRLEGLNTLFGTRIILNGECARLAGNDIEVRELDTVRVYGKVEAERIYELLGKRGDIDPEMLNLRDTFERALAHYRKREWGEAEAGFKACLEIRHDDGPSREYLTRLAAFSTSPPGQDWDGVWQASAK